MTQVQLELRGRVRSRDVPLHLAQYKLQTLQTAEARAEYQAVVDSRVRADKCYLKMAEAAAESTSLQSEQLMVATSAIVAQVDVGCYKWALDAAAKGCGSMDDYSLHYSAIFANLCNAKFSSENKAVIVAAITAAC